MQFTVDHDITYKLNENQNLIKYFNSNYALNKQDRKSILKYIYIFKKESVL